MCLKIRESNASTIRHRKFVYKVVCAATVNDSGTMVFGNFFYGVQDTDFVIGKFIRSSREGIALTSGERSAGEVSYGFHAFTSLNIAKKYLTDYGCEMNEPGAVSEAILKCAVNPKEHVADGIVMLGGCPYRSTVYASLTPIEVASKSRSKK